MSRFFSLSKTDDGGFQNELEQTARTLDGKKFAELVAQIVEDELKRLFPQSKWVPIEVGKNWYNISLEHPVWDASLQIRTFMIITCAGYLSAIKESTQGFVVFVLTGLGKRHFEDRKMTMYGITVRLGLGEPGDNQYERSESAANQRVFWVLNKTGEGSVPHLTEAEIREGVAKFKSLFDEYEEVKSKAPSPQQLQDWLAEAFKNLGANYIQPSKTPQTYLYIEKEWIGELQSYGEPQIIHAIRIPFAFAPKTEEGKQFEIQYTITFRFASNRFSASLEKWGKERTVLSIEGISTDNLENAVRESIKREIAPKTLERIKYDLKTILPAEVYFREVERSLTDALVDVSKELLFESLQKLFSSICSNMQIAGIKWQYVWAERSAMVFIPAFDLRLSFGDKELAINDVRILGPIKVEKTYEGQVHGRGRKGFRPLIIKRVSFYFRDFPAERKSIFGYYPLLRWFSIYSMKRSIFDEKELKGTEFSLWYAKEVNKKCTSESEIRGALHQAFSELVEVIQNNPTYLEKILLILSAFASKLVYEESERAL